MSAIVLLDTSIYLNILDIPNCNQDREAVFKIFEKRLKLGDHFLLPMATIWETGNHIADLNNGGLRYKYSVSLVDQVAAAVNGKAPYRPTHFPNQEEFLEWLKYFPEYAKRNKSTKKTREGVSLSDLTIIREWERTRRLNPMRQVLIWSLDSDLSGYDTGEKLEYS